ncbi:MAG: glycoside hydrolase family 25 protein [Oscillospiraceae bacterium]
MAQYKGIDLSEHNGTVDMKKVKADGISFVMLRSGYGDLLSYPNQKDKMFEQNYKHAKAAGLKVGIYHYMYALTPQAAKREAQGFLKSIEGKTPDFPVALDIEEKSQYDLGREKCSQLVKAFIGEVEKAGYYCMLYSYESFLQNRMSAEVLKSYDVWCANITKTPNIRCGIHQYSFTGKVSGCKGNTDLDVTSKNYPQIIKNAGLNGFKKPSASAENKTPPVKPQEKSLAKGDRIKLSGVTLYSSSTAKSGITKSGVYYIYDGKTVNGRMRITNRKENCGKTPIGSYVTGWVNRSQIVSA